MNLYFIYGFIMKLKSYCVVLFPNAFLIHKLSHIRSLSPKGKSCFKVKVLDFLHCSSELQLSDVQEVNGKILIEFQENTA